MITAISGRVSPRLAVPRWAMVSSSGRNSTARSRRPRRSSERISRTCRFSRSGAFASARVILAEAEAIEAALEAGEAALQLAEGDMRREFGGSPKAFETIMAEAKHF